MEGNNATKLKYPILLVHGFGFKDSKFTNYWGRIPKLLTDNGCAVFYGEQDASATIESNAAHLKDKVGEILKKTGAQKVNIIAHSKGGLEARYLISSLGMADKVASLTTICTPHHGCKIVDVIPKFVLKFSAFFVNIWMRILGDKKPDAYKAYLSFKPDHARLFNDRNPDAKNVYYQSYAFIMRRDFLLWFTHFLISLLDGDNDGLVTVESAMWGNFMGAYKSNSGRGISHCDAVDLRRKKFTNKTGNGLCDILEVYTSIVNALRSLGF